MLKFLSLNKIDAALFCWSIKNTVKSQLRRLPHCIILYLRLLESDISLWPTRTGKTSMLRMSRRPLSGGRIVFQPAVINECCRPSLNMIQRALPNLRIISAALLLSPQCLETCDFKRISGLIFFKCSFKCCGCRGRLENKNCTANKSRTKSAALIFF